MKQTVHGVHVSFLLITTLVIQPIYAVVTCYGEGHGVNSSNCYSLTESPLETCGDSDPDCKLICDGKNACGPHGGLFSYTCNGTNNLCEIECISGTGFQPCEDFTIATSSNTKLSCLGELACDGLTLLATGDITSIDANITCDGAYSCKGATFVFEGNAAENKVRINCDRGCENTRVWCVWDSYQCDVFCADSSNAATSQRGCYYSDMCCGGQSHSQTCNIYRTWLNNSKVDDFGSSNSNDYMFFSGDGSVRIPGGERIDCTLSPTNAPSLSPSAAPSSPPSAAPSNAPSVSPSNAPSFSPSAAPSFALKKRDIVTNYVMYDRFGINNFSFPAAIGKCMNSTINGDEFIKFECVAAETAKSILYENKDCTKGIEGSEVVADDNTFVCDGENTFAKLSIFPTRPCLANEARTIFVADSICAPTGKANEHSIFYCDHYQSELDGEYYGTLWLQHFADECSIYGFWQIGEEYADQRDAECAALFHTGYYVDSTGCYTIPIYSYMDLSEYDLAGYIVLGVIVVLPLFLNIAAFAFHRKKSGTDRPGYISVFKFFSSAGDTGTDAIFTLSLYALSDNLWLWSAVFTFGPHLLSILIGVFFIVKWRQNKSKPIISNYASSYDKIIVILSLFAGFYGAIEILTTHLFHLDITSFQIGINTKQRILNMKIINNVVLENIPCLYIQFLYLTSTDDVFSRGMSISLLATAFSVLGILFGVLTVLSRICYGILAKARGDNLNVIRMVFEFKSSKKGIIENYHIHTNFLLSLAISEALKVQLTQIEIVHIQNIIEGILVKAKIRYLDHHNTAAILKALKDATSSLYIDFYKQCTEKIKINSTFVNLQFIQLSMNKDDNEIDDDLQNGNTSKGSTNLKIQLTKTIELNPKEDNFEE